MKVKEAIEILSKMNQEAILLMSEYDDSTDEDRAYRINSIYSRDEYDGEIQLDNTFDCVIIK